MNDREKYMSVIKVEFGNYVNRILFNSCEKAFVLGDSYSEEQVLETVAVRLLVSLHLSMHLLVSGYKITKTGRISVAPKLSPLIPLEPALEPSERAYYVAVQVMVGETLHYAYAYVRRPTDTTKVIGSVEVTLPIKENPNGSV